MKFRTYGISQEQATKTTNHIFTDFYLRVMNATEIDDEAKALIKIMTEHPRQCQMLILSTLVFAVGNFDRIEKVERWATLKEDGDIDTENLEMLDPRFVV